jgi:acetolactate synthase-1/3 small subunit
MKHTLSVLVENKPGVLARVAGLFSRRGFNIDSLAVGITERDDISRITVVADVEEHLLEQVYKQLNKLINVIKVVDLADEESVRRELVLVKVKAAGGQRAEVIEIANIFRAKIVDIGRGTLTIELTGTGGKLEAFEDLLKPYGIVELVRTGVVALARG